MHTCCTCHESDTYVHEHMHILEAGCPEMACSRDVKGGGDFSEHLIEQCSPLASCLHCVDV